MLLAAQYWSGVVAPTLVDLDKRRWSLRHAIVGCLLVHHSTEHALVERLGVKNAPKAHQDYWANRAEDSFRAVYGVAIAAKHGARSKDSYSLVKVRRSLPAVFGVMTFGNSRFGDAGGVYASPDMTSGYRINVHSALHSVVSQLRNDFPELAIATLA